MPKRSLINKILILALLALPLSLNTHRQVEAEGCFNDVEIGHPQFIEICELQRRGIINGYEDGSYKPWQEISRAEAVKLLTTASNFYQNTPEKEIKTVSSEEAPRTYGPLSITGSPILETPVIDPVNGDEVFFFEYTKEILKENAELNTWEIIEQEKKIADFSFENIEIDFTAEKEFIFDSETSYREITNAEANNIYNTSKYRETVRIVEPGESISVLGEKVGTTIEADNKTGKITFTNKNPDQILNSPFEDVGPDDWFMPYIKKAKESGIVSGYAGENTFKPLNTISLVEALKIYLESIPIYEYPDSNSFAYADVPEDAWYRKYVAYVSQRSALTINYDNTISPGKNMTRGDIAEMVYKVIIADEGYKFGKASFYGAALHGRSTSSGEKFDMYKMTAAHKTLPFGTIVEVTNLKNGKSVQVKINDRGPYSPGRVLDLSSSSFEKIASLGTGIINVQYKIISTPQ